MNLDDCKDLPGAELVLDGIEKLRQAEVTENSLLVAIGTTRLRAAGLDIPTRPDTSSFPEHQLYRWLALRYGNDAHSRYNALVRRLVSFERALEQRQSNQKKRTDPSKG